MTSFLSGKASHVVLVKVGVKAVTGVVVLRRDIIITNFIMDKRYALVLICED
jgi:hypothetical protein